MTWPIDYAAVRREIPMVRVLALLDYRPTRIRGDQLRGRCPLPQCGSTSRFCFSVHRSKQAFRCFHCQAQGNQLDLWAAVENLPLKPATEHLCHAVGIPVPRHPATPARKHGKTDHPATD